jgi:hypothetical protein
MDVKRRVVKSNHAYPDELRNIYTTNRRTERNAELSYSTVDFRLTRHQPICLQLSIPILGKFFEDI